MAIVTHEGFSNYLLRAILLISPDEPDDRKLDCRLVCNNCAISRVDFMDDRIMMVCHNQADLLPDELVT